MPRPPTTPPGSGLRRARTLLADLDCIVWEADVATMRFGFVSDGVHHLLGYTAEEWLADPSFWVDRIHPADRSRVVGRFARVASAGGRLDEEYRLRSAGGDWVWIRDIAHAIKDEGGTPVLIRGLMVEINGRKALEAERAASEDRFRRVVEHLPAIVYLETVEHDPDLPGRMLYVSPQVQTILGFSPEEWMADPVAWARQFHPEDRARIRAEYDRIEHEGGEFQAEYRMYTREGAVRWMRDTASLVRDESGTPLFWQGIMFDATAERTSEARADEAEERYRNLVEQIPVVVYIDPVGPGPTVYISPQAEAMFGYAPKEWYDEPGLWRAIVHPDDRMRLDAQPDIDAPTASAYRIIAKDGREVWVHDTSSLIEDDEGRPRYWQGVLVDVTQQHERAELERAFERERDEAERLRLEDEMKTTFLQAVSHDLRTPLAAILGLALTLEREDVSLREEERRDLATRIAQNARKLDGLVADFLDLERLNRGLATPELQPVDVGALVRELVANSDLVAGRRLALDVAPLSVRADRGMVERIVENLLGNTVKHTPGDSRIWVRLERTDDGLLLVVEDDGPGVPEAERTTIFEPFRQGAGAGGGSGVGLALVARFAELHGGRAWVEDRPGGGASFHVLLSWEPETARARGDHPAETGSSADNQA
jgi:PAS domain S-box-containing protein